MSATRNEKLERKMKEKALVNKVVDQQKAIQAGRPSTVFPYNGVVRTMLEEADGHLKSHLASKGGKNTTGVMAFKQSGLSRDVALTIAARTVVDGVVGGKKLQSISTMVGARIEDEVRVREFQKREPRLWKKMQKQFEERHTENYRAKRQMTLMALMSARSEEHWTPWEPKTKAELGLLLCDVLCKSGIVVRFSLPGGKKFQRNEYLGFPLEVQDQLMKAEENAAALLKPWYMPMLEPPMPWTSPTSGGYMLLPALLVKVRSRSEVTRFEGAQMDVVYDALNAVQATPWKINEDVLVVAEELHRLRTSGVEGLPVLAEATRPIRPDDIPFDVAIKELPEEQQVRLKAYLVEKRKWFEERTRLTSKNVQALQIMEIAKELRQEPSLYFPHTLDYRGRMYPLPLQCNPQGNDLAKGLLTFATGKPLGEMGGFWLAVHGANTWGKDKGPLTERVDWVLEHEQEIRACAADPLSNRWWTEADGGSKPFQFLAFCLEWAAYLDSGESPEFVSHLPVSVDGACNGIQHFSALLRDEQGARATNLTMDPVQHDVYSEVAAEVNVLIGAGRHASELDRELAGIWTKFGVDRKVVKRPVMTTPYGATAIGMKDMVLEDTIDKNKDAYWGPKTWKAAQWLAVKIDEAIGTKLVAARHAMRFLQELAAILAANDLPIAWTTPAGFPVVQRLLNQRQFTIDTKLLGRVKLRYSQDDTTLDRKRQRSAVAPNFVHSYDAAHLQLTVVAMEKALGAPVSWAVVHDSFGTHAGLADRLGKVLRDEFVLMYSRPCPLTELLERSATSVPIGTVLPEVPPMGDFDLMEVRQAEFFFA